MKNCLIIIDYQNDYVNGQLPVPGAAELDALIARKILTYQDRGDRVLSVSRVNDKGYLRSLAGRKTPVPHCIRRTPGAMTHGMVGSLTRRKTKRFTHPGIGCEALYEYLKLHRFGGIEVVGIPSHSAVLANLVLIRVAQPETPLFVDPNLLRGMDPVLHNAAMTLLPELPATVLPMRKEPEKQEKSEVTPKKESC